MSKVIPTAVVIDRAHAATVGDVFDELGGAWAEMFRLWQRTDMEYLVLLAHTKERIRLGAPLTALARDADGLRTAMAGMCANLSNVRCRWMVLMEEGTEGMSVVREQLLADSCMEGRA